MPRKTLPLSNIEVKNAKFGEDKNGTPKDKTYFDGDGLFLLVKPIKNGETYTDSKLWRFKYRFGGKEKLISFGTYPEISLADARERRRIAREQIAKGLDPQDERKEAKQEIIQAKIDLDKQFHLVVMHGLRKN
jgi:hypothetical protein